MAESAKILIEVTAGVVPGEPMDEYRKVFALTSSEWDRAEDKGALLAVRNGQAQGYASFLMLQPDYINWVRLDWVLV